MKNDAGIFCGQYKSEQNTSKNFPSTTETMVFRGIFMLEF